MEEDQRQMVTIPHHLLLFGHLKSCACSSVMSSIVIINTDSIRRSPTDRLENRGKVFATDMVEHLANVEDAER
jgi:hypothetical protein